MKRNINGRGKKLVAHVSFLLVVSFWHGWLAHADVLQIDANTIITTGEYGYVEVLGNAQLDFYGDSIQTLDMNDTSIGVIHDGSVFMIYSSEEALLYLSGGDLDGMYVQGTAHIYGQDIVVEPYYTDHLYIHGYWGDGITPFDFIAWRAIPYDSQFVIHDVPEPITLSFLLFGIVYMRKRNLKRDSHLISTK